VIDPNGSPNELSHEYGITLIEEPIGVYDIIIAVGHNEYIQMTVDDFQKLSRDDLYI
jgi:UDP-N-acetyl-D-galactosamine dehydrogenase